MLPGRWQFWHDLCRRGATSLAKVGWSGADGFCAVTVPMVPNRASALAGPKRFFNIRSSSSRNGNSILLLIAEQKRRQPCIIQPWWLRSQQPAEVAHLGASGGVAGSAVYELCVRVVVFWFNPTF